MVSAAAAYVKAGKAQSVAGDASVWRPVNFEIQQARFFSSSGVLTSASGFQAILYKITGREKAFRASARVSGAGTQLVYYFNAAMTPLGYQFRGTNGVNDDYAQQVLTVPAGTIYIGITSLITAASIALEAQFTVTNLSRRNADAEEANDTGGLYWKSLTGTYAEATFYGNTGNKTTGATGFTTTLFPVTNPNYTFRASGVTSGNAMSLAVFFRADMTFLGTQELGVSGQSYTRSVILNLPTGTAFIAVNNSGTGIAGVLEQRAPANAHSRLSAIEGVDRYWSGKSAVWFGTSIPAGSNVYGKYPNMIAGLLGITMTNEAVGSSMARNGKASIRSAADPYGWTGLAWQNVAYGMAATLAEKNYLISNWATWRPLLNLDGTAPATLDAATIALWQSYSYETKLVANHLGANRKDLYVFDHGHNDNLGDMKLLPGAITDPVTGQPCAADDRGTFLGAMRFLINLILMDNPRARICFIGHYEMARKTDIYQAQQILADTWNYPLFKAWEKLGWTQQNVTIGGVTKTMTQWAMPDDLHPHSDTSGAALARYTRALVPFIRDMI